MEELLTPAEMAIADRLAGNAPILMEAAGRAVARAIRARYRPCKTLVLIGPGKNGGDGKIAARHLAEQGWPITVAAPGEADPSRFPLVIDAIFGAGLSRDVTGLPAEALAAASRIVAIDVPSGLDGGSGQIHGYAPKAELTITFFRRKPGHLLYPGRALCGETLLVDIGIPSTVLATIAPKTFRDTPALWRLPSLAASDHKYTRGTVSIASGAMHGAARLAAEAARRAGAGLAFLIPEHPAELPEPGLIVTATPQLDDPRRQIWVCGPGLGVARAAQLLPELIAANRTIVADADALTAFAHAPDILSACAVLTPHAGEFTRLFGPPAPDRLTAARAASKRLNTIIVLKGPDTIIAAPDGRAAINDNAPPYLATGGTGDVLAGTIAGLLAQGLPAFEAAAAAVWLNGQAATILGPGLLAEDLPAAFPEARKQASRQPLF